MADVFISYKAEDRRRVQPLVQALQADGHSVWWDEHISTGDDWRRTIEEQLNAARCVVVIWSKRSVAPEGRFVRDEASRAQARAVFVPVLIDPVQPPLGFGESQATSLCGWKGDRSDPRYQAVLKSVRQLAGPPGVGAATDIASAAPVSRRAVVAGGAIAATVAASGAAWLVFKPGSAEASDSIAVLPFANLSGDPRQAYFADGIAEELRSALSRLAGLKVVGRTSSEAVRNEDAPSAARKLGVTNILTGSFRQSPSKIRISAQLVDGRNGLEKWSNSYDRSPGDAIIIQTDIAENVARSISAALATAARAAMAVGGTSSAASQELYLRAKAQLLGDDSERSYRETATLLDSAIAIDPNYARAYALKAWTLARLTGNFDSADQFEWGFATAADLARKAIALAPNLPAGHFALAVIFMAQLHLRRAAVEFDRAHGLHGADVDDLLYYGSFLSIIGKRNEAIAVAKAAQARDRLNPRTYSSEGFALTNARRYPDAIRAYRRAIALAPNRFGVRAKIGALLSLIGRHEEGLRELVQLPPDNFVRVEEAIVYARQGNRPAAEKRFERLKAEWGDAGSYQYAQILAQLGDGDRAFDALGRAVSLRDPGLMHLKTDPWLDPLRSDGRFDALVRRIDYPA